MTDELIDRYGDPPRPVNNLIAIAMLRGQAASCGVTDISQKNGGVILTLAEVDLELISALAGAMAGRLLFAPGDKPTLTIRLKKGEDPLRLAEQVINRFSALIQEKNGEDTNKGKL